MPEPRNVAPNDAENGTTLNSTDSIDSTSGDTPTPPAAPGPRPPKHPPTPPPPECRINTPRQAAPTKGS